MLRCRSKGKTPEGDERLELPDGCYGGDGESEVFRER